MTSSARALRGSVLIAVAVVIADQVTKQWALSALADGPVDVVWTLRFRLVFNSGMAFGQGAGFGPVVGVLAVAIVVALLVWVGRGASRLTVVGVGLVVGGALGNVIDRVARDPGAFRGAVVDFIDFQWFPVFNVADISINVGAGLLILGSLLGARHDPSVVDAATDTVGHTAVQEDAS